jgi:hypothetical protein
LKKGYIPSSSEDEDECVVILSPALAVARKRGPTDTLSSDDDTSPQKIPPWHDVEEAALVQSAISFDHLSSSRDAKKPAAKPPAKLWHIKKE